MPTFPGFLEVGRVPPLVIGASELAAAKVRTLLQRAPIQRHARSSSKTQPARAIALSRRRLSTCLRLSPSMR